MLVFSIDFKQDNNISSKQITNETIPVKMCKTMPTNDVKVCKNVNEFYTESGEYIEIDRGSIERVPMELPSETKGEFKTYMDYRCITDESSSQFVLQQQAYTDENGFRRIDDKYIVALGTGYTQTVGDEFHIVLDSGVEFDVVVGDLKDPKHTDDTNRYIEKNGNIVEYLVDIDVLNEIALAMGDVSYAGFEGKVTSIERLVK
jgi:hypothetical protein